MEVIYVFADAGVNVEKVKGIHFKEIEVFFFKASFFIYLEIKMRWEIGLSLFVFFNVWIKRSVNLCILVFIAKKFVNGI